MVRPGALLLALLFTAPTIWQALADQTISVESMLVRYLIAVPVAAILLGLVQLAMKPSAKPPTRRVQRSAPPLDPL